MEQWFKSIIRQETEKCRVTTLGEEGKEYDYGILPIESRFNPLYLEAIVAGMSNMMGDELKRANVVVGIEAKSFVFTPLVAHKNGKSWVAVRKRDYKLADQIVITHETAYGKKEDMFCIGLKNSDRVVITDDMISKGGTMIHTINTLRKYCKVVGAATLYDRGIGRKIVKEQTGLSPKSLATIDVVDGKVKVLSFYPENNLGD